MTVSDGPVDISISPTVRGSAITLLPNNPSHDRACALWPFRSVSLSVGITFSKVKYDRFVLCSPATTEYYIEEAAELSVLSRHRWSVVKRSLDAPAQLICLPIVYTCKFVHDIDSHELSASFLFRLTSDLTNCCVSRWLSYSYPQKGTLLLPKKVNTIWHWPAIVLTCFVKLCLKTLSCKIKQAYIMFY